jgi:tetratricopeptide (TPR) repeat protein
MSKRFFLAAFIVLCTAAAAAQDAKQLHETARQFMLQRDYNNAILVLNRAVKLDSKSLEIAKDLGLNYYFAGDYNKALEIYKPLLDREDADDQCFQIAGDIYLALENPKECEKVYKKGLKKISTSGPLYNAYGELLWAQGDYSAIKQWEKGIETDPGFSRNYYNASKYYYFTTDKVWSIIYGEIFINIEPSGAASPEIKNILFEGYKKLFTDADLTKYSDGKNAFVTAFLQTMNKQTLLASGGINTESLVMIRSRFILDWFNDYGSKYAFRLFDYQRQLLQDGLFEAYNHWIFTASQNLLAYQNWITANTADYNGFTRFQKGRIFRIPTGQYYHQQ